MPGVGMARFVATITASNLAIPPYVTLQKTFKRGGAFDHCQANSQIWSDWSWCIGFADNAKTPTS